jgi:hypothetical protein
VFHSESTNSPFIKNMWASSELSLGLQDSLDLKKVLTIPEFRSQDSASEYCVAIRSRQVENKPSNMQFEELRFYDRLGRLAQETRQRTEDCYSPILRVLRIFAAVSSLIQE